MRLVYFDPGPKGHYHPGEPRYNQYLRELGYTGENPWDEWANAAAGDDGEVLSAWLMKYASRPTRLPEEHTETPYMTRRAMEFVEQQGQEPWCLHLSYIKPHWPYIVSAPYHEMYCAEQVTPVLRSNAERESPHPIYAAYMQHRPGRAFSQPGVREAVIPAYMGLISQIDDQLGLLFEFLQAKGQFDNTMIVFTSDHGDYLGDHWLGDKDFMHDAAVKIPMIVVDPSAAADKTRGSVNAALVESIDLVPTFIEVYGGEVPNHQIEGRSLLPLLHDDKNNPWRQYAISEYYFSQQPAAIRLGLTVAQANLLMITDGRFKYIEVDGFRPLLFDREQDPNEFIDVGDHREYCEDRERLADALNRWAKRNSQRTTMSDRQIEQRRGRAPQVGILIGYWDEADLPDDVAAFKGWLPKG